MIPTKKNNRTSFYTHDPDREVYVNTPGSFDKLDERIKTENINIETQEVVKTLPEYINSMREYQAIAFRAYYLRQMSMYQIMCNYEQYKTVSDAERAVNSSTNTYIRMIKADYGLKN